MLLADQLGEEQRKQVAMFGPKMDVTNVAEYYFHHDKEFWKIDSDFPGAQPPFDAMWVEYKYPRYVYSKSAGRNEVGCYNRGLVPYFGCFVGKNMAMTLKKTELGQPKIELRAFSNVFDTSKFPEHPNRWSFFGGMWYVAHDGSLEFKNPTGLIMDLDKEGNVEKFWVEERLMGKDPKEQAQNAYYLHPILMAFSLANCKNIEVVEVKAPTKLQKARARRGRHPLSTYRVVNVLPFGKTYRRKGSAEVDRTIVTAEDSAHVALHIRRGNFASYGEKYGRGKLFGKYEGRFWRPQTVSGSPDAGSIEHDYKVVKDA